MANQMIALQARAPQSSGLGNAIQQNAQMINMMSQQRAAERQTALANQKMGIEAQLAGPQLAKANSDATAASLKVFKDFMETAVYGIANARNAADAAKVGEILKTQYSDPLLVNIVDQTLASLPQNPADYPEWQKNNLFHSMEAIKQIDFRITKPTASVTYGVNGEMNEATVGGMPGVAGVRPLEQFNFQPTPTARTGEVEVGEPTFADGGVGGPDMGATPAGGNGMAGVASVLSNVNNDAEYQTVLNAINAQNPQMAASIRQAMPRFDPQRMAAIRNEATAAFGGTGAPDLPGLVAGERGGVGGPYVPTGRQAIGKDPTQAPVPGIYDVSPGQIRTTSGAEKTGEVEATRMSDLRKAFPKAKSALKIATSGFDRDIADVDYVLANPYREMVVGNVEGAFPSATSFVNMFRGEAGQEAQNVQARLNKITSKSIITHLQEMRDASPQGSSLFGQVTEYEDRLVKALGGLEQSQDEATFERALRDYRKVLVEMRQNLPQVFNDTFGAIGAKERGTLPPSQPRKSPTISDVEYLRRNKNNPNVVNGFRQHFGDTAFKMAMGVR